MYDLKSPKCWMTKKCRRCEKFKKCMDHENKNLEQEIKELDKAYHKLQSSPTVFDFGIYRKSLSCDHNGRQLLAGGYSSIFGSIVYMLPITHPWGLGIIQRDIHETLHQIILKFDLSELFSPQGLMEPFQIIDVPLKKIAVITCKLTEPLISCNPDFFETFRKLEEDVHKWYVQKFLNRPPFGLCMFCPKIANDESMNECPLMKYSNLKSEFSK